MASKLLLINVFVIDLIAFGLAVAAEQRRSTGTMRADEYKYCVYGSDIATGYGVGAFLLLMKRIAFVIAGSVRNARHTKYRRMFFEKEPSCETVRKGVFAAGAAFPLFTAIISQFYYVCYSKSRGGYRAQVDMAAYKWVLPLADLHVTKS